MTIRRLRLVAFLGFLFLVAASVAVTFAALSEQRHDALVVNLAGRQRMLSQQMALQALGVQIGANPASRHKILDSLRSPNAVIVVNPALRRGDLLQPAEEMRRGPQ